MIQYNGIKHVGNRVAFLCFVNSEGVPVEIPIDPLTADRIDKYISRITPPNPAEQKNAEPSD